MEIKNLRDVQVDDIYQAFVLAFTNYVIPIEFNREATIKRWQEAGVDFELSFGAFDKDKLVAFVLQVPVEKNLYNFMTGVIPSHRGLRLISKIYEEIHLHSAGYETYSLEVIRENTTALNLYTNLGFKAERELFSLKGIFHFEKNLDQSFTYDVLPLKRIPEMNEICLSKPAMEFSYPVLLKRPHLYELHCLRDDDKILAYAIFNPANLSLKEMGAKNSIEKHLDILFHHMKLDGENLRIMNLDSKAEDLIRYFEKRNLNHFVTQYEMKKSFFI